MSEDQLQSSRPAEPQRRYCVGRVFTIYAVVNSTDGLPSCLCSSDQIGRPLGLIHSPSAPQRVLWYQLVQAPLPAPSLSGGGSTRPPEVVCFSPLPVEAGLLLWQEVDVFPPWLEVDVFPPWLKVDVFPPWFKVDFFPPRSEVGWTPS